ncbi:AzlC family ABC transporter permease [Blastochloris tepida]|uniref:AzlC family protein n=1 Tax=Blastochloris tepida TaxID=2233851 RepID=A0A348FZ34_9HYPH|nr:AzlC family ABC transporter permease [Blastochloris tepida]BBF92567.1 AzlC family protein [Blastochloris tepida]
MAEPSSDPSDRPRNTALAAGIRVAFGPPMLVLMASFVGFGGLAHDAGWPLPAAVLATLLVWAMPGQVVLLGAVAAGSSPLAALLAVSLSAVRLMPMVVSLMPVLRAPRMNVGAQFWCAHFVAQTVWVESFRHLPDIPRAERPGFYLGMSYALIVASAAATALGHVVAGRLAEPLVIGLVFLPPVFFLLSLERTARSVVEKLAFASGLVLGPVMAVMAPDFDLMLTGAIGGAVAFAVGLAWERRA